MQSIPWLAQSWKPSNSRVLLSNSGVKTCPNFGIKEILFQNSYLSVYHTATVLFRDIRMISDFLAWVLYNIPTVPLPTHPAHLLFPFFLEQILISDAVIAKASNPGKSSVLSSHYSSILCQIQIYFGFNGDQQPCPWGMPSKFPILQVPVATLYFIFP